MISNTLHGHPQISTFSLKTEVGTPFIRKTSIVIEKPKISHVATHK